MKRRLQDLNFHAASIGTEQALKDGLQFLLRLNIAWNEYALNALQFRDVVDKCTVASRVASIVNHLEIIGSIVKVAKCPQKRHLSDKTGVIIGTSENAWKIAFTNDHQLSFPSSKESERTRQTKTEGISQHDPESPRLNTDIHVLLLPQKGTCLILLLKIPGPTLPMMTEKHRKGSSPRHIFIKLTPL